ncbi:hypothetical protein BKA62DRAFT_623406 [Auriculariales sp. MPI-PUGE-AT-0066]|nr:hypothetical protein BKA62DRAFT_623406 [Auriculariales sp. MPI-PUGE-AT-0066]
MSTAPEQYAYRSAQQPHVPLRHSKTQDPYATAYAAAPAALPGWSPYAQYHAPQPNVPPVPQGYGYFQWPSTETVDQIPEDDTDVSGSGSSGSEKKSYSSDDLPHLKNKNSNGSRGGLFSGFKRKFAGPDVHLHTLLLHARPAPLVWDIRNAPMAASRGSTPGRTLSAHDRAQFATAPARPFMRLTCDLMPWSIDVCAKPGVSGVTVGDVLDAVHAALQRRVRRSEWLIASERQQERIVRAFAWRCYNAPGPRGVEERQGPKRVDWLLKRTICRGLSRSGDGETWVLHLGEH